jgi:hypothetical protein
MYSTVSTSNPHYAPLEFDFLCPVALPALYGTDKHTITLFYPSELVIMVQT